MYLNSDFKADPATSRQRKFELALIRKDRSKTCITGCHVVGSDFRHHVSFAENTPLDAVIVGHVASRIDHCIARLPQRVQVVSLPTYVIETDCLTLGVARVEVTTCQPGRSDIRMRFDFFHGRVADAFHGRIGFPHSHECECVRVAERVLSDVTLPALNICEAGDLALPSDGSAMAAFMEHMMTHAMELKFQVELIRRFADRLDANTRDSAGLGDAVAGVHRPVRALSERMERKSA